MNSIIFSLILLLSNHAFAKKNVIVALDKLGVEQSNEKNGDELYLSVVQYSPTRTPKLDRIPEFPVYWLSQQIDQLKNVKLAELELEDNDSIQLMISLLEHDMPPLNVDDHIGSVKLTITNTNNHLESKWDKTGYIDDTELTILDKENLEFIFTSSNGTYKAKFSTKQAD